MDAVGDDRLADDIGREVAFVGDADELVPEADRAHDLGRRWEEGDDAHRAAVAGPAARSRSDRGSSQAGFSPSIAARAAALSVNQVASMAV